MQGFRRYLLLLFLEIFLTSGSDAILNAGLLCDGLSCHCGYELALCDCKNGPQEITVAEKQIPSGTSNLTIVNCRKVTFKSSSIKHNVGLRSVNINHVKNLQLPEKALEWDGDQDSGVSGDTPRLSIYISNTIIPEIGGHAFNGKIKEINFTSSHIQSIVPYAFSNLNGNEIISIQSSRVDNIQVQGFKKFSTNIFLLTDSVFHTPLTSRTFSDFDVLELFRISNCTLQSIKPSAFITNNPKKIEITHSRIHTFESEAFKSSTRGDVVIRNNEIGTIHPKAFLGFTVNRQVTNLAGKMDFEFVNNTINNIYPNSFDIDIFGFNVKLYSLYVNESCSCTTITKLNTIVPDLNSINCVSETKLGDHYSNAGMYQTKQCSAKSKTFKALIIVSSILAGLTIFGLVLFFYFRYRYKKNHPKEWVNNASPLAQRKARQNGKNGSLPMIVPDGRTYKETIVVVEQAELLTTEL